jgi:hypothetical protein
MRTNCSLLGMLFLFIFLTVVRAQFGCQLSLTNCTSNGVCRPDGICFCNVGYIGENCEIQASFTAITANLGKGFITGWTIFWGFLNLMVPYFIYILVLYCRKGPGDDLREHYWDCYEACCCCIMPPDHRRKKPEPDRPQARVISTEPGETLMTPRLDMIAGSAATNKKGEQETTLMGVKTEPLRPETSAGRRDEEEGKKSKLLHTSQGRGELSPGPIGEHLFDSKMLDITSSRLLQTDNLLTKQEEAGKKMRIRVVNDSVSMLKQMYPYEDFEDYDDEKLLLDIKKDEQSLNLKRNLKFKEMMDNLYK